MNNIFKYGVIFLLTILVFVQIFCINKFKIDKNINECSVQNSKYNYKTLHQITEELSYLTDKSILSANQTNGEWCVKIRINGNKYELINEMLKLKNYNIGNYTISKKGNEEYVILDITPK